MKRVILTITIAMLVCYLGPPEARALLPPTPPPTLTPTTQMMTQSGSWDIFESWTITEPTTHSWSATDSVPFSLFDPSLGDLTGVGFRRVFIGDGSDAYSDDYSQFDQKTSISCYYSMFTSSSNPLKYDSPTSEPPDFFEFMISRSGGSGWAPYSEYGPSKWRYYPDQDFYKFIGTDTFDMAPRVDFSFRVWDSYPYDSFSVTFEARYAGEYELNYWYEPAIPAPGALLLGTIGVAIVGWLRRMNLIRA